MRTNCKTCVRLSEYESKRMDALIEQGFAFNRSEFTRQAIRYFIALCEKGYFE